MLINDFYTTEELVNGQDVITARLLWNIDHAIFAGHFPGQPVVPGVCMIQIVQETLAGCLGKTIDLLESNQIKFLQFIDPRVNPVVNLQITYSVTDDSLLVNASLLKEKTIFFKFQGSYGFEKNKQFP